MTGTALKWLFGLFISLSTTDSIEGSVTPYTLPTADLRCLSYAAYREASGEPLEGVKAVSQVVLNRMRVEQKSCKEVVSRHKQFSWWRHGQKFDVPDSKWLTRWLDSYRMSSQITGDTLWFHSGKAPIWTKDMEKVARIGGHDFYKVKEKV